jgi:hypothetical protein
VVARRLRTERRGAAIDDHIRGHFQTAQRSTRARTRNLVHQRDRLHVAGSLMARFRRRPAARLLVNHVDELISSGDIQGRLKWASASPITSKLDCRSSRTPSGPYTVATIKYVPGGSDCHMKK